MPIVIHQLSHGNLYDGTSTKALRVQLAQPVGSNDIYARLTQYAVVGGNSFNAPKVSDETGATTPDASNQPVSRLVLARKGKGFATVRFRGTTDLNGGAVVYREDGYPTGDASDGYIESDGTGNVNTFFHPTAGTYAEVDFAFTELESSTRRIIGDGWWMEYQHDSTKNSSLYVGSDSAVRDKTTGNAVRADTARHVVAWDDTGRECRLTTAGEVALTLATPAALPASTTSQTRLFGPGGFISKARIYRAQLSKTGVAYNFAPTLRNGVPGYRDRLAGGFISGATPSAFTFGGFGRDGNPSAAEDFTAVPSGARLSMQGASATLTAALPGADCYEWLKNGEVIDGATNSSLTVAWRKGGGSDVYSVRGVQTVAGATVRSAAVSATVEFPPTAFVLIVR